MHELLVPIREEILADPLAGFRATMDAAPESDKAVMADAHWQRVFVEDIDRGIPARCGGLG